MLMFSSHFLLGPTWRTEKEMGTASREKRSTMLGGPISKHTDGLGTNKNLAMGREGAGEDQQQFTAKLCYAMQKCIRAEFFIYIYRAVYKY
jgi:hypothetical protein